MFEKFKQRLKERIENRVNIITNSPRFDRLMRRLAAFENPERVQFANFLDFCLEKHPGEVAKLLGEYKDFQRKGA